MSAKRTHDVVATIGTYKDGKGNEKKRYLTCGSAFTDDQGRQSIKLDAVPVSPDWSGWLSLYPVERKEQPARDSSPAAGRYENAAAMESARGGGAEEDDIPF